MTSTTERPLRADAERNRQRILLAAREVFARRGLHAGLDEIARHAGVGTGTVYRRYPDKQVLIDALFEDRFDQMERHIERAAALPDPFAAVADMVTSMVTMQIGDRGLKDAMLGQCRVSGFRARQERMRPLMEGVLQRAQDAGSIRPDVTLTDLVGMQIMLTDIAVFTGAVQPDLWRRHLALLLDGLRTVRAAPTPLAVPPLSFDGFDTLCGRNEA